MTTPRKLSVRAYAKINLSLLVTARRADGYHELRTVFQALALADRLDFTPRPGPLSLSCTDPAVPTDERNLVWTAAQAIWTAAGRDGTPEGIEIRLTKRITAEGGLGGGSADAAAMIATLAPIWGVRAGRDRLAELAAQVGADVPYFLGGGTALCLGRGDEIHPLRDRVRRWVTLAMPPFGVSTAQAFQWFDERAHGANAVAGAGGPEPADGTNDLEGPVVARYPAIGRLIARLRAEGAAVAAMTGSGSTVYGVFGTRAAAESAAGRIGTEEGVRTVVTRTASSAECRRMLRVAGSGAGARRTGAAGRSPAR